MKQIEDRINEIVKKIKQSENMSEYCFLKGYEAEDIAQPLTEFVIVVTTLDTLIDMQFLGEAVSKNLKGEMYVTNVKFRVYAPKDCGGSGLLDLSGALCDAIKKVDTEKMCKDIKIGAVSYDSEAMTVYRDVTVQFSFCLYEEVGA
ncbi:MAG: hypothetical protein IKB73_07425 [Ruminococcus sp.]|nr:hypothetical protein [Ruminococcus sp.]